MKLDLIAIRKLSPAGLWDLAELTALISTLVAVIRCGICDGATVRLSQRMLKQYRRELRECTLDNFNKRVKAWVMQCPGRIAYVRSVIGEAAIKRWRKNRLLDYAFTQAFGDWESAFPNGLKRGENRPKQDCKPRVRRIFRTYVWKPFALLKIPNANRILYGQDVSNKEAEEIRAAYHKLWGVPITDTHGNAKISQPRPARQIKPIRFRPEELVAEAATGVQQKVTSAPKARKLANREPEIFPPPKPKPIQNSTVSNSKITAKKPP